MYNHMNDYVDDFALRVMQSKKYTRPLRAVEKSMQQYGITRPLTIEQRKLLKDLPYEKNKREDEVLRRFKCSKLPRAEHEVAQKLSDLYVYADVGKSLCSDEITLAVMKSLKLIENEIPPPDKREVAQLKLKSTLKQKNETNKKKVVDNRTRELLNRYSQVGEIKRKLYSMPEYVRNRDQICTKLPQIKQKSQPLQMNLNISQIRGSSTKMGRVIVKQHAKQKKMEDLKQQLNPFGKTILKSDD